MRDCLPRGAGIFNFFISSANSDEDTGSIPFLKGIPAQGVIDGPELTEKHLRAVGNFENSCAE